MIDTTRELRGKIAEQQILRYRLAADVGVHPARLGQMLNGRLPMTPDVAERIRTALKQRAQE